MRTTRSGSGFTRDTDDPVQVAGWLRAAVAVASILPLVSNVSRLARAGALADELSDRIRAG